MRPSIIVREAREVRMKKREMEEPEKVTSSFPEALGPLGKSELARGIGKWAQPVTRGGRP